MHIRHLVLFASLAMPIIAMPIAPNHIAPREDVVIDRRGFSVAQLYRDLFKRESLIEAIPRADLHGRALEAEAEGNEDEIDTLDEHLDETLLEDGSGVPGRRWLKKPPGGARKRWLKKPAGGAGKRWLKKPAGGAGKRWLKKPAGGAGKRWLKKPAGGAGKRSLKKPAGGAGKRWLKKPTGGAGKRDASVPKTPGGGPE